MIKEKIKSNCRKYSKCGLSSYYRCATNTAGLDECKACTLVKRRVSNWKMINRKPYKRCSICGEFRPLSKFYPKKIKRPNGVVYYSYESACKLCRSSIRKKEYYEKKGVSVCVSLSGCVTG